VADTSLSQVNQLAPSEELVGRDAVTLGDQAYGVPCEVSTV
jgi:hypothetical protein